MDLKTPIVEVAGIGESHARLLAGLGIETIEDLLWHLPRRWVDYSNLLPINKIRPGETVSVHGRVAQIENKRMRTGRYLTQAIVADDSGLVKAVWFNQPFLTKNLHVDDEIYLSGTIEFSYGSIQMQSPAYEVVRPRGSSLENDDVGGMSPEANVHTGRIIPIYPETAGVTSKWLRGKILPLMKYIYSIKDYLPDSVKKEEHLIDLPAAIRQMHFPENQTQLEKAQERLDFDEMFLLQTAVLSAKKELAKDKAIAVPFDEELIKRFVQSLGFELTVAQRKSAWDILKDLAKGEPMNRLLQGDVGSGKTVVAAIALLQTAASRAQGALLCPTEILAKQHYAKLKPMLDPFEVKVVLLTGSTPREERLEILAGLRDGDIKVVIGTHAILEHEVEFWRLALAIVDEQHRFGVDQRAKLKKESLASATLPHFLAMTATPIPRTLTLTVYGDLDVSMIYELPPGRQKIITKVVPEVARQNSYEFIKNEIDKGHQAYVVCPLVEAKASTSNEARGSRLEADEEESGFQLVGWNDEGGKLSKSDLSESERKSVMSEYERLSHKVFPGIKVGYIHGQMKTSEKELSMSRFISGETKILVSSSVIEVGVDVPNATIMMIEDAERFGLAQLHQFRGRVGRGSSQSYCLLFTSSRSDIAQKRLEALVLTDNGFKLADADLEIRGPGDFIGGRQHGLPDIKMKNLMDITLIQRTREAAKRLLSAHDVVEFPILIKKISKYSGVLNLE